LLHTNKRGYTNVTPTKRNTGNDRYTYPSCADRRSGDPMRAYLVQIELEVDFQTYGPEPDVGINAGFDIESIYSPDDPHKEDVSDMLSQKAIDSIYEQVEIHLRKMKDDY
jgi:hypothetical protein